MTIRSHLLLLALACVLPIVMFAALVSAWLLYQERSGFERSGIERARAMMTAVDAQLLGEVTTVKALSAALTLASDDIAAFTQATAAVLATQPSWYDVTLSLPDGETIVDARGPGSVPARPSVDTSTVALAFPSNGAAIGDVVFETPGIPAVIAIRVPVLRDGSAAYVLTALVKAESFEPVIQRQGLPEGWVSGIVDGQGRYVARVPHRPAGELASLLFRTESEKAKEGWYRGLTVEGIDTFSAFERSALGPWTIGLGVPAPLVMAGTNRTAWLVGAGALVALGLALFVTIVVGRRIVTPMKALAAMAARVGDDAAALAPPIGAVQEIDAVTRALAEADQAVRERQALIQRESNALQAADRAKDAFIAMISHELRNPLAALMSASAILGRSETTSEAVLHARDVIRRQIANMSRMLEDLLDVSRVATGKAILDLQPFNLAETVAHVVRTRQMAATAIQPEIRVVTQPAWILGDRTRVEQIVSNLLENAIKFTPASKEIRVSVEVDGGMARLSVQDDGQGIEPEALPRVFDMFFQGDQGPGRLTGGLGLGLALVKRLVEMQGGTVSVTSEGRARGSTFTVRLPLTEERPAAIAAAAVSAAPPIERRVLVVDDNEDGRRTLCMLLAIDGHETFEASGGRQGIELAQKMRPDVALIDIGLPDVDGYEVARAIRAGVDNEVVLVALTGYGQPDDKRRAFAAGFDAHIVKPVTFDRLMEAVRMARSPQGVQPGAGR